MKHFVTMVAIFSFLSIPSAQVSRNHRDIASVKEEKPGFPRYEALIGKVKPESLLKEKEPTEEKFQAKLSEVKESLEKSRKDFKQKESDERIVKAQRQEIEALAIKILLLEETEKALDKKVSGVSPLKETIESLITDLESNEALLAKKEEPKIEVNSTDRKEDVKEEPKKELCEAEEKQKALTAQVEELMKQQQEIIKIMIGMGQSILQLQQQQALYFTQGPAWKTSPYQYQEPMTAGNWIYYPQGFRPDQSNIFGPSQNPMQSFYPDQIYQQPLMPQPQFQGQNGWMMGTGEFGQGMMQQPVPMMAPQNGMQNYGMQNLGYSFSSLEFPI